MMVKGSGIYPGDWIQVALRVKEEAGWRCIRCGHEHSPSTGHTLTVHHIDMDKSNCEWWNMAALCQRCHLRIQGKVRIEQVWMFRHSDWFKPYVAGYYAHKFGFATDRRYVESNMDNLINLGQSTEKLFRSGG